MVKVIGQLPEGCDLIANQIFGDARGWLYEGYKGSSFGNPVIQITVGQSCKNSLRGMHAHVVRHDYIMVMSGCLLLGLVDLRKASATFGESTSVELNAEAAATFHIPPGVAHGFCFHKDTIYITGLSSYWTAKDEIVLSYKDPVVDIDWGVSSPLQSEKDIENAIFFSEAVEEYAKRSALLL